MGELIGTPKLTSLCFSLIVLDDEADYLSVFHETESVIEWFTLGLYLNLPLTKLKKIDADYRFNEERRREMLAVWIKTGTATWSTLFCALNKMGLRSLGKDIANRRGR